MAANPFDTVRYDDIGFDISHNNAGLDFKALNEFGGRKVCFLKITEGTGFVDPRFEDFVNQILDLGLSWELAAYHFAHGSDPKGQVDHFLSTFSEVAARINDIPSFLFMLDCERGNNPPDENTAVDLVAEMSRNRIPNPIMYCGYDFFSGSRQVVSAVRGCSHFLAAYSSHPKSAIPWRRPDAVYGFDWWQYTGDGLGPFAKNISGGSRGMDLSVFNREKNPTGFRAWWEQELAKTTQPA